jgi:hypothetical protein
MPKCVVLNTGSDVEATGSILSLTCTGGFYFWAIVTFVWSLSILSVMVWISWVAWASKEKLGNR